MDFDNQSLTSVPDPNPKDTLAFEVEHGDETYRLGWRADGLALQRAADHGLEVGEILQKIARLSAANEIREEIASESEEIDEEDLEELADELEKAGLSMSEYYQLVAEIVWVGCLRITPEMKLDAVLAILDHDAIEDLPLEAMLDRIVAEAEEEDTEESGK